MTALINTDSFGNTYFNYYVAATTGEFGHTNTNLYNFLLAAYGSTNVATNSGGIYVKPPHANETITSQITSSLYRYLVSLGSGSFHRVADTNSNTMQGTSNNGGYNGMGSVDSIRLFGIANQYAFSFCQITNANLASIVYCGTLKDPAYSGSNYPRNYSYLYTHNLTSFSYDNPQAYRPSNVNSNVRKDYALSGTQINHAITCTNATSSPDLTDLILRDSTSPYYAIGSCYNILKSSASMTIGQLYNVPNTVDGNTDQKRFLCVGNWGTEKLLMRVWTEGI